MRRLVKLPTSQASRWRTLLYVMMANESSHLRLPMALEFGQRRSLVRPTKFEECHPSLIAFTQRPATRSPTNTYRKIGVWEPQESCLRTTHLAIRPRANVLLRLKCSATLTARPNKRLLRTNPTWVQMQARVRVRTLRPSTCSCAQSGRRTRTSASSSGRRPSAVQSSERSSRRPVSRPSTRLVVLPHLRKGVAAPARRWWRQTRCRC